MPIADMTQECEIVSDLLKTIAHPARLKILCFLSTGKKSVGELEKLVGISQSAMSQYLKAMGQQSLLGREKVGQTVYYWIQDSRLEALMTSLSDIFCKGDF